MSAPEVIQTAGLLAIPLGVLVLVNLGAALVVLGIVLVVLANVL